MHLLKSVFKKRFKVSEERLTFCRQCDRFNATTSRCNECGCYMEYRTLLPFAYCPLGLWDIYVSDDPDDILVKDITINEKDGSIIDGELVKQEKKEDN